MTRAFLILLSLALLAPAQQPIRLEPGDYRWVPFTIRQTPAEVDCSFQVLSGDASVHVELMPNNEFRLFERGRDHDAMTRTPDGSSGEFRQVIDVPGRYAVVVVNGRKSPTATVILRVATNMNPTGAIAKELSPLRRLVVIVISLVVFLAIAAWSARRLLHAVRT